MKLGKCLIAAGALVVGTTAMSASAVTYFEDAGIGVPPVGALEWNGEGGWFSGWDMNGRTIATAEVVADSTIDKLWPKLWQNTDADVYQLNVTDAANFSAQVGGGHSLILFDAAGNALAGVLGNGPSSLIDSSWLSGNGTYYLGLGADGSMPQNAAGGALFALSGTASAPIAGDTLLAADPFVAWSDFNGVCGFGCDPATFVPVLLGPGNFKRPSSIVRLAIPEPASMTLIGLGGLAMLRRRG